MSSSYSSLQKSKSNMTTLERKESKSPRQAQPNVRKAPAKHLSPDQLKTQLEQRILADHQHNLKAKDNKPQRVEAETQKTENKHHKFGIRVLPLEQQQKSPKIMEQNENNMNIEKNFETVPIGVDEVDESKRQAPPVKKREKKPEEIPEKIESFERNSLNGSGIKRDERGIPQEIPNHMFNAAVAARKNRRNSEDFKEEDDSKAPKRKGKAPSPPAEMRGKENLIKSNFDEIQLINEETGESLIKSCTRDDVEKQETNVREEVKDYNSDSDVETDNQSSVNTIELNSSDITIHQTEEEERKNRRTASTGDLTKIQKNRNTNSGTLERAQSLDITDTGIPSLSKKLKAGLIEDMKSDEDIFGKVMIDKEPRLSLILDGLTTFQRNRLKKSTEWGNLEDAILKLNQEDESVSASEDNTSMDNFKFSFVDKSPEFDALVNKINEIKRESLENKVPIDIAEAEHMKFEKKIKNQIWPSFENEQTANGAAHVVPVAKGKEIDFEINEKKNEVKRYDRRQQIPNAQEITFISPPSLENTDQKVNVPDKISFENKEITDLITERRQLKPVTAFDIPTPEYKEEAKIAFSSIQINSKRPEKVSARQRVPEDLPVVAPPSVPDKVIEKVPETFERVLNEDWNVAITENIINTSPPLSLEIEDVVNQEPKPKLSSKIEDVSLINETFFVIFLSVSLCYCHKIMIKI